VRIAAQLIQVRDQTHIWARQYDREQSNLLALQGEVAQEIADEIQITLGDRHAPNIAHNRALSSPASNEAYDLYLKGRYFWNKRTPAGFQQAAEYFQRAIAKDPNYAPSYAGLADDFTLMSSWSLVRQEEFIPQARAAALTALQIDETLAEAHTSLALIAENYDYDWKTAEKEYRRAIQLDPSYATAHQWYAECLSFQGRFEEALAEGERARQLDPLSLIIAADYGAILYFSRQYDRAIEQFRAVREMEANFPRANMIVFAYVEEGRFTDALADIETRRRASDTATSSAEQAYVYGRWGQPEQARRALAKFEHLSRHPQWDPTSWLVLDYAAMDRKDEAIALLQKGYSEHSNVVTTLKVEPNYDRLRGAPRFQELIRRVGLAQ
jgi:Tfp pilus assembly protein PilF